MALLRIGIQNNVIWCLLSTEHVYKYIDKGHYHSSPCSLPVLHINTLRVLSLPHHFQIGSLSGRMLHGGVGSLDPFIRETSWTHQNHDDGTR